MAVTPKTLTGAQDFVGDYWAQYNVTGGDGDNMIITGFWDDTVDSGAGNDDIYTLDGNDTVHAGSGNDYVEGAQGNDHLFGGCGIDEIHGGIGNDTIDGEDGNDYLLGEDGDDDIEGGGWNDSLEGGLGNDKLKGEDGDDYLNGDHGDDTLDGGNNNDELHGGYGKDTLIGGAGYDELHGGGDDDFLFGGSENDMLYAGEGNNTADGGSGIDTIRMDEDFDAPGSPFVELDEFAVARVDLAQNFADVETLGSHSRMHPTVLANIENIVGTDTNGTLLDTVIEDHLYGNSGANRIDGMAGDDRLEGRAGDDVLKGDGGKDILVGGAGVDQLYGGTGTNDNDTYIFGNGDTGTFVPGVYGPRNSIGPMQAPAGQVDADTIHDWEAGDKIDLSGIDANTMPGFDGDQNFSTIVTTFTAPGQLMIKSCVDGCGVFGEVNGDGVADFAIHVMGPHTLTASDFIF